MRPTQDVVHRHFTAQRRFVPLEPEVGKLLWLLMAAPCVRALQLQPETSLRTPIVKKSRASDKASEILMPLLLLALEERARCTYQVKGPSSAQ